MSYAEWWFYGSKWAEMQWVLACLVFSKGPTEKYACDCVGNGRSICCRDGVALDHIPSSPLHIFRDIPGYSPVVVAIVLFGRKHRYLPAERLDFGCRNTSVGAAGIDCLRMTLGFAGIDCQRMTLGFAGIDC